MSIKESTQINDGGTAVSPPASHAGFWQAPEKAEKSAFIALPTACINELIRAVRNDTNNVNASNPVLTETTLFASEVAKHLASDAPGMAIVENFPVDQLTEDESKRVCHIFSELIGSLIPQDINNTLLYDVKNKHVEDPMKVRKSITNLAQPFHTDGGWLTTPARVIGLFCISNAVHGGGSEMTSLLTAYAELERLYPQEAAVLRGPLPWNKQGEHAPEDQPWEMNPIFENVDTNFMGRYYESYVTTGYDLCGEKIDPSVESALRLLKSIIEAQPRFSMTLKAGDFQLVNNWTNVHARKEFKDSGDIPQTDDVAANQSRHLIRVWCS